MYRELLDTLTVLASRIDVLTSSVMHHRTWVTRLHGIGVLSDSGAMLTCTGVLLRSTGVAWDLRVREIALPNTEKELITVSD